MCADTTIKYWDITVAAWGPLYATGTEEQAEKWRKHKARWERCIARKKEVDVSASEKWDCLGDLLG